MYLVPNGESIVKVVLLAGGSGTRISELTQTIPKPMISVGNRPILWHIMRRYTYFGHTEFIVALGYKSEVIKDYFINYRTLNADFTINLSTGDLEEHGYDNNNWKITLLDTGLETMTGGRLKRTGKFLNNEPFMLTYGDGLSDINIDQLLNFHNSHGRMVTVTAVRPIARFGELMIDNGIVKTFKEKPQMNQGWINGGYFIMKPEFLELIEDDQTILEKEPLEKACKMGELMAYSHDGFWQCIDTKRDLDMVTELWDRNQAPWVV